MININPDNHLLPNSPFHAGEVEKSDLPDPSDVQPVEREQEIKKDKNQEEMTFEQTSKEIKEIESNSEFEQILDELSQKLGLYEKGLGFNIENDYNKVIVNLYNRETNEIIRQIPQEEILKMSKNIHDFMVKGSMIDLNV